MPLDEKYARSSAGKAELPQTTSRTVGGVVSPAERSTTSCGRVAASAASRLLKRTYAVLLAMPLSAKLTAFAPAAFCCRTYSVTSHSYHCGVVPLTGCDAIGVAPAAGFVFHVTSVSGQVRSDTGYAPTAIVSPDTDCSAPNR